MKYRLMPSVFVVSLGLSVFVSNAFAGDAYSATDLKKAIEAAAAHSATTKCNPFVDPGCHVPTGNPDGPPGCTDCAPNEMLKALRVGDSLLQMKSIDLNGSQMQLLEPNGGTNSVIFSLPKQTTN